MIIIVTLAFVVFTVGAAVAVAERAARPWVASALAGWVGVAWAVGRTGFFAVPTGPPRLALGVLVPFVGLLGAWRMWPAFRALVERTPLPSLILVQTCRLVGVALLLGWSRGVLPAHFAVAAGAGDILTGLLAPLAARTSSRRLAIAWNVLGLLDLVDALTLGVLSAPSPLRLFFGEPSTAAMAQLPLLLLPAFIVPLALWLHVVTVRRLLTRGQQVRLGPSRRVARSLDRDERRPMLPEGVVLNVGLGQRFEPRPPDLGACR